MKITKEEVEYVAHLARLDFTEEEKVKFTSQLNDILMYMDKLNEADTAGIEAMSHAIPSRTPSEKILSKIPSAKKSPCPTPRKQGARFSGCRKL